MMIKSKLVVPFSVFKAFEMLIIRITECPSGQPNCETIVLLLSTE